jgi:hypothetical protein
MTPYRFATIWHVRAPAQRVWDAFQHISEWWPGMVLSQRLTPDHEGVGARYERLTLALCSMDHSHLNAVQSKAQSAEFTIRSSYRPLTNRRMSGLGFSPGKNQSVRPPLAPSTTC